MFLWSELIDIWGAQVDVLVRDLHAAVYNARVSVRRKIIMGMLDVFLLSVDR